VRGETGAPIRLRFAKCGKVRFLSHRDVARAFERARRIAEVPVAFTQGFSPRPKVSFGLALAVGYESRAEYLDVERREDGDPDELAAALTAALPEGLAVTGAAPLAGRAPALQEAVTAVGYQLTVAGLDPDRLARVTAEACAATTLRVVTTRKGQPVTVDVRPSVRRIDVDGPTVSVEVSTQPRAARAAELCAAFRDLAGVDAGDQEDRVLRTHQWIERDGARLKPLEADRAAPAPTGTGPRALEACA